MKRISILLASLLILASCGGSEVSEEPVPTTVQDTTTTTVQDTTTTTVQAKHSKSHPTNLQNYRHEFL